MYIIVNYNNLRTVYEQKYQFLLVLHAPTGPLNKNIYSTIRGYKGEFSNDFDGIKENLKHFSIGHFTNSYKYLYLYYQI